MRRGGDIVGMRLLNGWSKATALGVLLVAVVSAAPVRALETAAAQALLIDATTGVELLAKNADSPMAPASMSKMMTVYLLFEALKDGRLSLEDTLPVSETAWRRGGAKSGGSTMFLEPGSRPTVEDLIRGIVVQSGNDASIVVAEALSGSEAAFAAEMTRRGREIGLTDTTFRNATGWPDPEHLTTARDMAMLAWRTIEDFPEFYHYYEEKVFTYNGIRQSNRNPLLYENIGADGLKTGHTEVSGYGLTGSMKRDDRRLILVVNGLPSVRARSGEAERLLSWGFREFDNYALFDAGESVAEAEVWLGKSPAVPLVIDDSLVITLPRKARPQMTVNVVYDGPIPAPIAEGDRLATLVISAPGEETREVPLRAGTDVPQLGVLGRLTAALKHIVWGQAF